MIPKFDWLKSVTTREKLNFQFKFEYINFFFNFWAVKQKKTPFLIRMRSSIRLKEQGQKSSVYETKNKPHFHSQLVMTKPEGFMVQGGFFRPIYYRKIFRVVSSVILRQNLAGFDSNLNFKKLLHCRVNISLFLATRTQIERRAD